MPRPERPLQSGRMKIARIIRRLCLLIATASLARAYGTTLYVATSGNDSNPGTAAQPFQTISFAYRFASPGTTIIVAPGVYTDYQSGWGLHLGSSGTPSSPIVLQSQVRGGAVIDGQNASDRNVGIYIDGSYNVVEGFEIRNGPKGGVTIYGNSNQILNNEIDHNGNPASTSTDGMDGAYDGESTSGNIYYGNYIHDNGRTGGSNLDHGLYLCGSNEQVINNILVRNDATGLQIAGYLTVSNLRVYNNVIAWNGHSGIILWQALNGITIENNLIYANGGYGIGSYAATGGGVVVDHNLTSGNGDGDYNFSDGGSTYAYALGTAIYSDPLFVNESAANFDAHLAAGSPAIGAGLNLSALFSTDQADASRPTAGAWDLGALVYAVTVAPPTVDITTPANGATVSGSVTVLASASSGLGVGGVQFKLDGTNIGPVFTAAPYGGAWDSTSVDDGAHTFTALVTDTAGNQATATPVTVLVSNTVSVLSLPSVSVVPTVPKASRVGPVDGLFTITRSGGTSVSLTVNLSLGGTAVQAADYSALGNSVTVPAGAASTTLTVAPLPSTTYVGSETAVLTLVASSTYALGATSSATVTIAGNGVATSVTRTGAGMKIAWKSVVGKAYMVAYKQSLSDPTWTDLSGSIIATGTVTSYLDTTAGKHSSRYYVVYVTN